MNERLTKQMDFIIEIDRLKNVFRQSLLTDASRRENDTEHSWHLAMMAFVLSEHANESVDVLKVLKMVLIHDIVEIDAGDTYAYDEKGYEDKYEREDQAAKRIFGILPEDQAVELRALWDEFEARQTNEARFANALDRVHPIILNYLSGGKTWRDHQINRSQVLKKNSIAGEGSEDIWSYILEIINKAVDEGYLVDA